MRTWHAGVVTETAERLTAWFDAHARDLPWRRPEAGPWGVLVSEVMLQQTPVSRVEPIWYRWLARWPRPAALAADPPAEAIREWGRLGYPRRALRLHECAGAIVTRHAGEVPDDLDALLALPGIGGYTARAVAAFAFGQRQQYAGTDRQVRGLLLAVLRDATGPVPAARLDLIWPDAAQRTRALAGLVDDGLVRALTGHRYTLPAD